MQRKSYTSVAHSCSLQLRSCAVALLAEIDESRQDHSRAEQLQESLTKTQRDVEEKL